MIINKINSTRIFLLVCVMAVHAFAQQPVVTGSSANNDVAGDGIEVKVQGGKAPGMGIKAEVTLLPVSVKNNSGEAVTFVNKQVSAGEGIIIYSSDAAGHRTPINPSPQEHASTDVGKVIRIQPGGTVLIKAWIPMRLLDYSAKTFLLSIDFTKVESGKSFRVVSAPFAFSLSMNTE